jgi:hypothetical protein
MPQHLRHRGTHLAVRKDKEECRPDAACRVDAKARMQMCSLVTAGVRGKAWSRCTPMLAGQQASLPSLSTVCAASPAAIPASRPNTDMAPKVAHSSAYSAHHGGTARHTMQ